MTSPLLPHARALIAAELPDDAPGRLSPGHLDMLWRNASVVGPGDVEDLVAEVRRLRVQRDGLRASLASLCTALEASEAEAGRLREERESFGQSIDMLIVARDEAAKRIEAERDKLRALLAEACDIGERIERDSGNWRPTDRTRLATIRTEALK
jgi:transposase